ncbi:hypothetical protein [uncultured Planococcus sp.]|uniref:hypothetical protein n=1 Tax=uncultured Planococcus sp. TaxID=337815 RepID=UPI002614DBC0|nr:hypothetical protein [uncultured Planococcus sp.]
MKKLIAKLLIVSALVLAPLGASFVQQDEQTASIEEKETEFNTSAKDPGGNGG